MGQGSTQTELYKHRRWLEAGNFVFRKKRNCAIPVAKTKTLISFSSYMYMYCKAGLCLCFAYAYCWLYDAAQLLL